MCVVVVRGASLFWPAIHFCQLFWTEKKNAESLELPFFLHSVAVFSNVSHVLTLTVHSEEACLSVASDEVALI